MSRKSIKILLTLSLLLAFAVFPFVKPQKAYALDPFKFEKESVTLTNVAYEDENDGSVDFDITSDSCKIKGIDISEEAEAKIKIEWYSTYIRVWGLRECKNVTFDAIGTSGVHRTLQVTVDKSYMNAKLNDESKLGYICYGLSKVKAKSWKGATVKLKIGSKTYSKKTDATSGKVTIPLSKVYKMDTKMTATFTKDGYSASQKYVFGNGTFMVKATAKKKTIKVKCFNLHKGDIVKLKYKKKTYSKKITKNYHQKNKVVTFKVSKKVKPKNTFTVKIFNKYKQPHHKVKWKVRKGTTDCKSIGETTYGLDYD